VNCLFCKETRLRYRESWTVSETGKTQSAECPKCLTVYTLVTVIACEADAYGTGARALATKLKKDPETLKDFLTF